MSAPKTVTVVLADDHPVVRSGLAALLDTADGIDVVAAAANGQEAVDAVSRLRPAVVLMDLRMPVLDGAGATAQIRDRFPDTKVLVLTTYDDDSDIMRAVESGAVGYLLKDTAGDRIIEAVRAAARGETVGHGAPHCGSDGQDPPAAGLQQAGCGRQDPCRGPCHGTGPFVTGLCRNAHCRLQSR